MKLKTLFKHSYVSLAIICITIFSSCERITFEDYALIEYDGQLTWQLETEEADWPDRIDPEVVVFQNKLWVMGGYNPGEMKGDSYYEDVWSSEDGKSWKLITNDAPWKGRRGHRLVNFDDGTGEAIFLIGGFSSEEKTGKRLYKNDVWKSKDGKNWELIKSGTSPELDDGTDWFPRMYPGCVVTNHGGQNYIYLFGGRTMRTGMDARYATIYFNDVWRSTDGANWEKLDTDDYGIRSEHAFAVDENGTIYTQGGLHGLYFDAEENGTHPTKNWHHLYTTTDGVNWTERLDSVNIDESMMWRSGHKMVHYRGKLWTLPGKTTSSVHYTFSNPNHYSTWTHDGTDFGIDSRGVAVDARHNYAAVVFQDKIWVLGGYTNRNGQSSDVWSATLN